MEMQSKGNFQDCLEMEGNKSIKLRISRRLNFGNFQQFNPLFLQHFLIVNIATTRRLSNPIKDTNVVLWAKPSETKKSCSMFCPQGHTSSLRYMNQMIVQNMLK